MTNQQDWADLGLQELSELLTKGIKNEHSHNDIGTERNRQNDKLTQHESSRHAVNSSDTKAPPF